MTKNMRLLKPMGGPEFKCTQHYDHKKWDDQPWEFSMSGNKNTGDGGDGTGG